MQYVNFRGDAVSLDPSLHAKPRRKAEPQSVHKGWRVVGVPPGDLQEARDANARLRAMAERSGGNPIPAFDEANWLMNAKKKSLRPAPYSTSDAANACKALAEKAGWLAVEVVEVKKEVA